MNKRDMTIEEILELDLRREAELRAIEERYDPIAGLGSPIPRVKTLLPPRLAEVDGEEAVYLPQTMVDDPEWRPGEMDARGYVMLRFRHDFEYWAFVCVKIRDKVSGRRVALRLNRPQRRYLALLEEQRRADRPIRVIMLKARQCGSSTLTQMYFAYIQIIHRSCWNSIICGHIRNTAATIRRVYRLMLDSYPQELRPGPEPLRLKGTSGGSSTQQEIAGTGSTIDLGTAMAPDSLRGNDFALAHLSEVAFWEDTPGHSADDFIRTVSGSVPLVPCSAIIMESTANGVGNFFHRAWLEAEEGRSAYRPIFVPWYEIDMYRKALSDEARREVASTLTPYETSLFSRGASLAGLAWWRDKRREYHSDRQMLAEFPASATEAFVNTGCGVFDRSLVEAMRASCSPPLERGVVAGSGLTGRPALRNVAFRPSPDGPMQIWRHPDKGAPMGRYVVTVDIGGRSPGSDWSVIAVIDRLSPLDLPEVVAQWRGHADHDIVCWQAAAIGVYYAKALLVIESNSLEGGGVAAASDASLYILGELRSVYPRLYVRQARERVGIGYESRPGFHTNRQTKVAAISALIAAIRERGYIERSHEAIDEMLTYEVDRRGAYNARAGYHDDILMTRAISLYVISQTPAPVPFIPGSKPPAIAPLW
ncbi:MAG: hypothetical protein NC484_05495 [Alloprevotella sp.]|nr:hypothetical protein [Alloprevotella sp.]